MLDLLKAVKIAKPSKYENRTGYLVGGWNEHGRAYFAATTDDTHVTTACINDRLTKWWEADCGANIVRVKECLPSFTSIICHPGDFGWYQNYSSGPQIAALHKGDLHVTVLG